MSSYFFENENKKSPKHRIKSSVLGDFLVELITGHLKTNLLRNSPPDCFSRILITALKNSEQLVTRFKSGQNKKRTTTKVIVPLELITGLEPVTSSLPSNTTFKHLQAFARIRTPKGHRYIASIASFISFSVLCI